MILATRRRLFGGHADGLPVDRDMTNVLLSPAVQATFFEVRYRWWVIVSIFCLGFSAYFIDPRNSAVAPADGLAARRGTSATDDSCRLVFAPGSLMTFLGACLRAWGTPT